MITIDTSALYAVVNVNDVHHLRVMAALRRQRRPHVIPVGILAEITYLIESRLPDTVLQRFLADLEAGRYLFDCGEHDIPRIRQLVRRYADLTLGFADAAVIACAERRGGRVLTLDERHFGVVAREGRIVLVPE